MKYSNTVEYNINTKLDASGLTKLQSQIKQVELSLQRMGDKEFLNSDRVADARKQLEGLNTSLTKSFNSSLGILDLSKLQRELQTAGVDAKGLNTAFSMAGAQGQAALNGLITQIGNFNGGIERTSSQIDKIFTTFSNTFRWGLVSSFFSQFMNAIHQSVDYVKELDDSLTQIMLVTDYNRDSMNEYAKSANEAAKALSMSTTGMTNASLVFAQQGYNLNQSQELATLSAKLANASQQDTATTSDQITAYMNAYGLENSIEELTQQMDNWALIANVSAADVGELAQASQRAASMANAVGVSGEQLAAQIATIESVTREAPEQIGNGLKTLYARFSDIAAGKEDEDGFSLGKVTSELNKIGVQVLNEMGQIRDVGDIMEDLMVIWDDLDQTSKVAASQALAGKYQVNRFMALMDNSTMYQDYLGATGSAATGTLDQMNQEYAESLAGRTQKLQTTLEGLFNDIFTTDTVYPAIDALTKLADGIDTVFKSIGDGPTILLTLASAFGQLFSTNIARSVNNIFANQQLQQVRQNNIANVGSLLDQYGLGDSEMGQYVKNMAQNAPKMNQEQYDQYMAALKDWSNTTTQLAAKEEELQGTLDVLNMVYGTKLKTPSAVNKDDETGKISFTAAEEARANLSNKQLTALASKEDFIEETQQIMSLSKELGKAQSAYENFKSGIVESGKAMEMFDLTSDRVVDQLIDLKEAGILSDASFDQLSESFKQITQGLTTGTDDINQLEQELDELIRRFVNLGEAASSMDPNTFKRWILSGIEEAKKQEQELQGIRVQDEQNKDAAQGQIDNIVSQNAIEGVIKVTSSLGELASTIITIQNLGQILTDDDLSPMEKFVQILTGMGVLIPTIIIGIKEFSDGIKLLKDAKIAENIVETISQGLIISNIRLKKQQLVVDSELAAMNKALAMAEGEASGAGLFFAGVLTTIKGAAASALAVLGPVGLAIAAIGIAAGTIMAGIKISDFIGDLQEAEAQQKAFNELTDQTQETVNKLNETAPALNELYDAYKETGEASDEFKRSLADQAELLGINDAALLISQGKYEELKEKIDKATEAVYNNNAALQQAKLDKVNPNDMVNELSDDQKERYGITYHQKEGIVGLNGGTAEKGLVNKLDQTPYELIKAAQQDIEIQQEKINSLTQKRNDLIKEGLTATGEASRKVTEDIANIDTALGEAAQKLAESKKFTEDYSGILEATNAIRDNNLEQELNNSNSIFKTGNYEEINKFISAQQGVDSSNVDELIAKYAELAGNVDVAAEATKKLKENIENTPNNLSLTLPENNYRTDDEQKNIQETLKLSDEEYKGYQNVLVDDNEHLQALSEEAQYLEKNKEILQEHRQELKKETIALQEEKDALEEKAEKLKDNKSQYAKTQKQIQDYTKQIEKNQKELKKEVKNSEDVRDQLEDLENKIIETAVGAKELGKVWEDNSKVLRDGDSDWAQQADAINNLAPGLAHLLNMDLSDIQALPQSFWESTQNLNDMEAAINGDVEALQRLRGEATKELLVKAGVDPTSDLYGEMLEIIDMANAVLPDLEAGATINDSQFIAKLNEMIATTIAAGGNIEAVLASYERLGLQFTQTGSATMRVPKVTMSTKLDNTDPAQEAAISTYTANPIVEWETVDVPTYDYKKTSGGANFTGGYTPPSTGGGGGGKGKSCFVAGTLVSTWGGFKPIEQIKKGNIVLSYNQQLGLNEYSEVLQTMIHDTIEPIYTLYIKDEQLKVTGIHRFLVTNKIIYEIPQWVHAADLKVGDWVLFADGTWHVIHKIEINIEHQTVYNFEVSNNHNYYVGRNQILAHNKGGGKKGGGGGKKKEISTKEKKNHEKDYYEKVDSILDKTEKTLKGIQDKQDKLIGDKAQGNLRKQINLLEKELKVQKEKLKILTEQEKKDVERKLEKDDASLEKILKKNSINQKIPAFKRDMDGIIINYEEVSAAIDKAYNKLIDKQKAAAKAGKEETAKSIGEQIDKFEKLGESIRKGGKRSDEIQAQIEELNNTIQETEYAIQDARIEGFKLYSEARDGLKDILESGAELKKLFRDFDADSFIDKFSIDDTPYGDLIENLSKLDDIYNITEEDAKSYYDTLIAQKNEALKTETDLDNRAALENSIKFFEDRKAAVTEDGLQNGYLGIVQQDLAKLQEWMENPQAAENIWGTDENGLFETFKDLYNQLLDGFKDYRKVIQETRDNILEIYDDTEEAIDRQLEQFDRLTEKIERISDTYTLYYGEDSYDQLDKFYTQQGNIMQAQLDQLTAAYDLWRKNYEQALENGDEELIKKTKDLMDDAEDAMLDGAKKLAELWVEKFENAVEANTQSIYNKLFNGQDFNDLSSNWELQKDYMERYKDDVEKSYEIEKLRSKYADLLNDSQNASLLTQNKIRQQMQEQLQQLQEQATVSEYDVKLANARLEILQKQIALEDAQRNKRQMQLRRDSQGNYRYVYKADQKDVKEAQDDLLDSEFDAYELTKNETISNNDRALNLVQDFLSKRADIFNKYKDDDVAREKALEELSNNYSKLLAGMEEDFRDTTNGMFDVLTFMVQNGTEATAISAANMLDNLFEEEGKFKEDTEVLWAALVNTMTGALEEFQDAIAEANDELIDQAEDLKDKMTGSDGVLTKIGSSSEKMANSLNTATQATINLAQATDQLFTAFNADDKRMEKALAKLKEYEDQLQSTQDTTSSLSKQLANANAAISAKTAEAQSYQDALDLKNGAKDLQNGQVITLKKGTWVAYHRDGDQYDASGKNGFKLEKDTQVTIAKTDHHHTSEKYGPTSELAKYEVSFYETGKKPTKDTGAGLSNKSDSKKTEMWHLDAASIRKAITYDTGGYTGKWDDGESNLSKNGKLAILHQKELVLNATDTENILNAVNVMREITNTLKNSNMYVSTFRNAVSAGNDTIEQRVEISATFPNVSSITDIEQALLNLSDQAYQYAHRNIKG